MARAHNRDLYRGRDVLDLPAYGIAETARYLDIPAATLRYWVFGGPYETQRGPRRARPVIQIADGGEGALSFRNLIEAHVLDALRRQHHVRLPRVRAPLWTISRRSFRPRARSRTRCSRPTASTCSS